MDGLAAEYGQQEACCNGGADDASHIGTHGVHQQVIAGIVLPAHILADPGSHGNGGDTGGANEGLTFPLVTTYRILPMSRPPTVDRINVNTPRAMIFKGVYAQERGGHHRSAYSGGRA